MARANKKHRDCSGSITTQATELREISGPRCPFCGTAGTQGCIPIVEHLQRCPRTPGEPEAETQGSHVIISLVEWCGLQSWEN